ncbi:MAG: hypothetical protein M1380_06615 [Chloroflexi bacterium]|nr:hypothetical protein [Chloroflexota bacterium]
MIEATTGHRIRLAFAVLGFLVTTALAACSGGPIPPAESTTALPKGATVVPLPANVPTQVAGIQPTRPIPTRPPTPTGAGGPIGQLVITGQVREVDASARVITLVEPVHGLESVALTDKTQVEAADGSPRTLQDVKPGVVIQAGGTAGGSNSVLASKVRILTAPSPIPQS